MKISRGASLDRYYLIKLFGFGVFLHRIHHSDPVDVFHNHPWNCISFIFGEYKENFLGSNPKWKRLFNWIPATRYHSVSVQKPVWTLLIHGRKFNEWTIADNDGKILSQQPWEGEVGYKDYLKVI